MAYRMKGTYIINCNCRGICPCPIDAIPTGPGDECRGVVVFRIDEGNLDDVDLSGVLFVWYNVFPSNILSGNWKVQFVVDEQASDQQLDALMRIITGQEGGLFAEFSPLVGDVRETTRAPITMTTGDRPAATIGGASPVSFEPVLGPDGSPVTVRNATVTFSPEYKLGRGVGSTDGPFGPFEHVYGETSEFEAAG